MEILILIRFLLCLEIFIFLLWVIFLKFFALFLFPLLKFFTLMKTFTWLFLVVRVICLKLWIRYFWLCFYYEYIFQQRPYLYCNLLTNRLNLKRKV